MWPPSTCETGWVRVKSSSRSMLRVKAGQSSTASRPGYTVSPVSSSPCRGVVQDDGGNLVAGRRDAVQDPITQVQLDGVPAEAPRVDGDRPGDGGGADAQAEMLAQSTHRRVDDHRVRASRNCP